MSDQNILSSSMVDSFGFFCVCVYASLQCLQFRCVDITSVVCKAVFNNKFQKSNSGMLKFKEHLH